MSGEVQRFGQILDALATAKAEAPSEIVVTPEGRQAVIQWQGTPVSDTWIAGYLARLVTARLAEPVPTAPADASAEARAKLEAMNDERLDAWVRALGGLPKEGLEAARVHFEKNGIPEDSRGSRRWFLRPSDVSKWVRARAVRRIPPGQECESHAGQWADRCSPCAEARKVGPEVAQQWLARIRAELAEKRKQEER